MTLFKPLDSQKVDNNLTRYFQRIKAKSHPKPTQIRVYSQKLGLDYSFPTDSTHQPYHIASVGKVFTATLVQVLAERGLLSTRDSIHPYFSPKELDRLFVYQNTDHASEVTIEHLLGHTSGIADYFEGGTISGKSYINEVLSNPQVHWTPQQLIEYTRDCQSAVGIPGKVFNYSDTGYILLGLIIEKVTRKSFAENLEDEFFRPLDMRDSYLMFYSDPINTPKKDIQKIWFNDKEISGFESLSCDWSGGGIVSTTADLLKFSQALREGRLIQKCTLEAMDACHHKFRQGIYYGLGMMEIRFSEFFFLLGKLPKIKGHIGILSTHMFYDPTTDAHIIMNFGDNRRMVESFKALIQVENSLQKLHPIASPL
jgi:D-alanyl-D-alanine carboxypeptidase